MDYLKSILGGQDSPTNSNNASETNNVAETVERLVERVETSTLLEDRRDACRALKSLSKSYRLEVGAQSMDALVYVLQNDSSDTEIVAYALDTLNTVIGSDETEISVNSNTDLSTQFTEIFIKRKENVQLVLDLLPEYDFKIRYPTIKLLYGLLRNKQRDCQDCILTHPMGISRLMDLLSDPREVIRNDALLLLVLLTKSNANIQKIVAFENAFDRILDIVSTETYSDGGVVVEDCLSILLNLLKMNTSNQNFFKEGSYIQKLLPFFDIPFDTDWNPQKINNLLLMFQVIRCLVSPSNPLQVTNSCQKVMSQSGVLQKLCTILLSNGIPVEILTETINSVAEVIRGNQPNQDYFSRVNAPIEPPKPVIVILLMSMVNEKQPFELRCAILYCFQAFLYRNELGQAQIIETLLPTTAEVPSISAGQLLCGGLFSTDALSNWFVAVALSYTLVGNVTQKEQLLRVQLATEPDAPPTSLFSFCCNLLQKGGHSHRRISLLMLLSTWLSSSSMAVSSFLSTPTSIPYLTSQVGLVEDDENELFVQGLCAFLLGICIYYNDNSVPSFTKDDLCKLITNRIGVEIFVDKLSLISKNEKYSHTVQKPQLFFRKSTDVVFDYEFCLLFKSLEGIIQKIVQPSSSTDLVNGPDSNLTNDDHKLLLQYKELIREQDQQLVSFRKQLATLQAQNDSYKIQYLEQQSIIQQLRDQNSLLKVQKSVYDSSSASAAATAPSSHTYANSYLNNSIVANSVAATESNSQQQLNNNSSSGAVVFSCQPSVPSTTTTTNSTIDETQLRHQIDQLNYELSVKDQNIQYLTNQISSISLYNNSNNNQQSAENSNTENAQQSQQQQQQQQQYSNSASQITAEQYEYLINENHRLMSILDQYKQWEQSYYAAIYSANDGGGGGLQTTNSVSVATNAATCGSVTESSPSATNQNSSPEHNPHHHNANQYSDTLSVDNTSPQQQQHSSSDLETSKLASNDSVSANNHEVERLRSELDSLRKEQDDLLIMMADQDIKMCKYVKQLKQLGHEVKDDEDDNHQHHQTDDDGTLSYLSQLQNLQNRSSSAASQIQQLEQRNNSSPTESSALYQTSGAASSYGQQHSPHHAHHTHHQQQPSTASSISLTTSEPFQIIETPNSSTCSSASLTQQQPTNCSSSSSIPSGTITGINSGGATFAFQSSPEMFQPQQQQQSHSDSHFAMYHHQQQQQPQQSHSNQYHLPQQQLHDYGGGGGLQ